jgi:nicotinate-nucleotide adenylyltransferase
MVVEPIVIERSKSVTPLQIPSDTVGLVVLGGTFDPPHLWHTRIASAARRRLFGEKGVVVLIPAARSPLKNSGPVASDADRLAMLRLATRRMRRCVIWTDELDRAARGSGRGPSYTIDTLERLRRALRKSGVRGSIPIRLVIGADQAVKFHRWRRWRQVVKLAEPAVVLRKPHATPEQLLKAMQGSGAWSDRDLKAWARRVLPIAVRDLSSTAVRGGSGGVSAAVGRCIRNRGLYARKTPAADSVGIS